MTDQTDMNPAGPPERDLRLDLLRGIGQWMVFLDHVPYDVVGWLTIRNYGFSDATEFFVFISGYCAGYIYGPAVRRASLSPPPNGCSGGPGNCTSPIFSCF
jgi:hypothetical protein